LVNLLDNLRSVVRVAASGHVQDHSDSGQGLVANLAIYGISEKATSMTATGALLGISYGGALIIQEVRSGNLTDKDIFLSASFMYLCHGLIEDTLFVMTFGGH